MQYPKTGKLWGDSQTVMGLSVQKGFSYTGEKVLRDWVLQAECFVTSNTISAYPADGIQQGYYYKLFGQTGSVRMLKIDPQLFNNVKDLSIGEVRTEVNENGKM